MRVITRVPIRRAAAISSGDDFQFTDLRLKAEPFFENLAWPTRVLPIGKIGAANPIYQFVNRLQAVGRIPQTSLQNRLTSSIELSAGEA